MGYSGNDPRVKNYPFKAPENLDTQEIEKLENDLAAAEIEKQKENPAYDAKESKVFKGRFAPLGKVFLIITHKTKKKIYTRWTLVNAQGLTQEDKEQICFDMWETMSKQYGLTGPLKGLI
jgi:hypothetical protein